MRRLPHAARSHPTDHLQRQRQTIAASSAKPHDRDLSESETGGGKVAPRPIYDVRCTIYELRRLSRSLVNRISQIVNGIQECFFANTSSASTNPSVVCCRASTAGSSFNARIALHVSG